MSSSTGNEVSVESATLKHGYFSQALIDGLSGQVDYNKDGVVYLTELDAYVVNRVKELSKDSQHPVTAKPPNVRPFALSRPWKWPIGSPVPPQGQGPTSAPTAMDFSRGHTLSREIRGQLAEWNAPGLESRDPSKGLLISPRSRHSH
jgi:hypothetical protein